MIFIGTAILFLSATLLYKPSIDITALFRYIDLKAFWPSVILAIAVSKRFFLASRSAASGRRPYFYMLP
jgi:hypothetical protein